MNANVASPVGVVGCGCREIMVLLVCSRKGAGTPEEGLGPGVTGTYPRPPQTT